VTGAEPGAATVPARRRQVHRTVFLWMLGAVACAAGAVALARRAPAWWSPVPRDAPGALDVARALEQGIAAETTRVRGTGSREWSVRVRAADVNAWLGARLPQWLEHDRSLPWPEGVKAVQVRIDRDGAALAADWNGFVVTTRWVVEPGAVGAPATLRAAGTSVGSLPLPLAAGVGAWFVPELGRPLELRSRLGDGRSVAVVDAEFGDGEAILDCVTAPEAAAR
jgi:hypothetical protein